MIWKVLLRDTIAIFLHDNSSVNKAIYIHQGSLLFLMTIDMCDQFELLLSRVYINSKSACTTCIVALY